MNEVYDRTEKALAVAETNLERSRQRSQRLRGVCACAILASFPLWALVGASRAPVLRPAPLPQGPLRPGRTRGPSRGAWGAGALGQEKGRRLEGGMHYLRA